MLPGSSYATMATATTGATSFSWQVAAPSPMLSTLPFQGPAPTFYEMNPVKGQIGESITRAVFSRPTTFSQGNWMPCTPARVGNTGIDNLFIDMDRQGRVRELLVMEAKYGSSQRGMTAHGRQMGAKWINHRLERTAVLYDKLGDDLGRSRLLRVTPGARRPSGEPIEIPVGKSRTARVWKSKNGILRYDADAGIGRARLMRFSKEISRAFHDYAAGKRGYQAKELRIGNARDKPLATVKDIDPLTSRIRRGTKVEFRAGRRASPAERRIFKWGIRSALRKRGYSSIASDRLAEQGLRDPAFLKNMRLEPRWAYRAGLDRVTLQVGLAAGAVAALTDAVLQVWTSRRIDLRRLAVAGGTGAVAAMIGRYAGVQVQVALETTRFGARVLSFLPRVGILGTSTSSLLGGAAGGAAAAVIINYGLVLLGKMSMEEANRSLLGQGLGVALGFGASTGAFALIATFGTASTGTAISSLGGAAATSATMAWLGGGSIAAGGGGMAMGSIIASGGTAIIVIGVALGVSLLFKVSNDKQQRALITGRLTIIERALQKGRLAG